MNEHRPNVLLITTDQQRFDTIQGLNNDLILTPHLNYLLDSSIAFTNCYSDCPLCMPARTTIMSGRHAYNHGLLVNGGASPLSETTTLPQELHRSGYQTHLVGKTHFGQPEDQYGLENIVGNDDYFRDLESAGSLFPRDHGVGANDVAVCFSKVAEEHTTTWWTIDRSIQFLEHRDESRPFFLWTSLEKPHPPIRSLSSIPLGTARPDSTRMSKRSHSSK